MSLGLSFIWFGILKPFGISPAGPLVEATFGWVPGLSPSRWLAGFGWWEGADGVRLPDLRKRRILGTVAEPSFDRPGP